MAASHGVMVFHYGRLGGERLRDIRRSLNYFGTTAAAPATGYCGVMQMTAQEALVRARPGAVPSSEALPEAFDKRGAHTPTYRPAFLPIFPFLVRPVCLSTSLTHARNITHPLRLPTRPAGVMCVGASPYILNYNLRFPCVDASIATQRAAVFAITKAVRCPLAPSILLATSHTSLP